MLPIGLITNIAWASLGYDMANTATAFEPGFLVGMMLLAVGGPALSLSYVSGVVLLSRSASMARLFVPFAAVGRLALTNYLIHSIVMTTIFYGYGFWTCSGHPCPATSRWLLDQARLLVQLQRHRVVDHFPGTVGRRG